jgi:hypothetical protein
MLRTLTERRRRERGFASVKYVETRRLIALAKNNAVAVAGDWFSQAKKGLNQFQVNNECG